MESKYNTTAEDYENMKLQSGLRQEEFNNTEKMLFQQHDEDTKNLKE